VHYRGAAPALSDVIAGHINVVIMGPSVALSSVKAGKLKMLAFGSEKRVAKFPDVPTIAETVPGYEASVSFGLFYAIVLSGEIVALMDEGEVILKAGDVLIQRGTNHAWSNRTDEPAYVAFVLIDAERVGQRG
jgi:tripartite-type tricarboxylate transporter receptor subunit TctC